MQNPQAIIIAHTTEYIPRLVHIFGSDNGTLTGYVNKTLTGKLLLYISIPLKHLQIKNRSPLNFGTQDLSDNFCDQNDIV